ncbi:PH domain-containing protein [Peribacillus huizhouensis]|uniref:Membrane protein n=1 Tax=Peribacillus huizhouensis TaxID=1501239 RepID=A0ABR6CW26_9BACI|nr:PH domain-containing protein [Peribacillus huizhouensis]MBA9029224.1 putative membrane protein [Peribacillus huizhouensis]
MFEPKRLHPVAVLSSILQTLKEAIIPLIVLLFLGSSSGKSIQFIIFGVICFFLIIRSFLSWLKLTYWVEDGELRIESGVFIRKKRYIRFERIHSIDVSEGIVQRIFGLVQLKVETAGANDGKPEAELTAITKQESNEIVAIFNEVKARKKKLDFERVNEADAFEELIKEEEMDSASIVFKQTFPQLFLMAATSGGIGVVLSGAVAFLAQFDELIPFKKISAEAERFIQSGVLLIILTVLLLFILAYLIATARIVFIYAYFTVRKVEEELIISRGLLEKRQLTIPLKKIQGIRISENLIRQPLGYASVYLEYAGGSALDKDTVNVLLFPLVNKEQLKEKINQFVPGYELQTGMKGLPKRSYIRYFIRQLFIIIPVIAFISWFIWPWGLTSFTLIPITAIWAYLIFREGGWNISGNQLQLRTRVVSKHTYIFQKNRLQVFDRRVSYFQRRRQLCTIAATVKSGAGPREGKLIDLEQKDAEFINDWFSYSESKKSEG